MTQSVSLTIPKKLFPIIRELANKKRLVPEGYKLSAKVILQFEPLKALVRSRKANNECQLLPNGVPVGLQTTLVEVLSVEPDEVQLKASLWDPGVESIDLLAIIFNLERQYKLTIPHYEILAEHILPSEEDMSTSGRRLSPDAMQKLRKLMPYADFSTFEQDPTLPRFNQDVLTVDFLKKYLAFRGVRFV